MIAILIAHIKINLYLLTYGMWKGECQFTGYDHKNNIILIAAGK